MNHIVIGRLEPLNANALNQSREGLYRHILNEFELMIENLHFAEYLGLDVQTYMVYYNGTYINLIEAIEDILIPNTTTTRDVFTQLPPNLPPRIQQHAENITRYAANDFERAVTLMHYLHTIPYTLTPGDVPEGVDFVYHFLFNNRMGYCVYHATAMVVMARSLGLPARYLEGYIVTSPPGSGGWRRVDNSTAHAWVEIYFEGYGWKRFEPTPAYLGYIEEEIDELPPVIGGSTGWDEDPHRDPYDPSGSFPWLDYGDYDEWDWDGDWTPPMAPIEPEPYEPTGGGGGLLVYFLLALLALIGLILLVTFVRFARYAAFMKRLRRKPNNAAANSYFKLILKYAKFKNISIYLYETPNEYAERIGERLFFNNEKMFMRNLASIYTKAEYSGQEISTRELFLMRQAYDEFIQKARNEMHRWRYVFYKYTLGKL